MRENVDWEGYKHAGDGLNKVEEDTWVVGGKGGEGVE